MDELREKFEACSSCNIMNMPTEYRPYSQDKNIGPLFDNKSISIRKQPYPVLKRFMDLVPGLTAHKLSFTSKAMYMKTAKLRGINVRIDAFEQSPRVFKDGSIFVKLENVPKNLLSHVRIKTIDIEKYDANLEMIQKIFAHVAEKHQTMKIVTDCDGKHLKFLHPGVRKAIVNFCNDDDDVYETLKLLPNVQYAVLNFFCERNFLELQTVKPAFKKWVQTKPTPVISVFLDLYGDWFFFNDNKFYRVLGSDFVYVEDL